MTDLQGVIGGGLSDFCAVFYRQHLDNVLSSRLMRFVAQLQQICAASCLCLIEIDRRLIAAKGGEGGVVGRGGNLTPRWAAGRVA